MQSIALAREQRRRYLQAVLTEESHGEEEIIQTHS
jgi:hypothetical protein